MIMQGDRTMARRKVIFGILIFLGFAVISILYFVVMSGGTHVQGTVSVGSSIVSWEEKPLGIEADEMVAVNGYCIKGPDVDNRLLLSTKNKHKKGKMKYTFAATEGKRHLIVVYLQLEHLTGDIGQTLELQFMTDPINKEDMTKDFIIAFEETNDIKVISITVGESADKTPKVFEYPVSEIPEIIKI
jgi:hypothetical protein